jgi:PAS domain S-box-containing protein
MDRPQTDAREAEKGLLDDVPAIVWELRAVPGQSKDNFRVTFVSKFAEKLLGYPLSNWTGDPDFWLQQVHVDDREQVRRSLQEMLGSATPPPALQFRMWTRRGQLVWLETNSSPIQGAGGAIEGLRNVSIDITPRKRAQATLRRRASKLIDIARELRETNRELDQFAYITSHDLRAPLRGIANLSRWIEEDMGERFTPEAHKQMELLRGRVHRMEALIDGILQYSRVGRVSIPIDDVDVGQLLREVIDLLAPPANVKVVVKCVMPTLRTEKLRMQQVFLNLIGNAIKHNPRPDAVVEITCHDAGAFYAFSVRDNGPGIAPEYHEKIFVMFQTLQARDKVEGTGVGLSLVRKIVEHHGGQISVDSREGEGAIFRFTWPKEPSHDDRAATQHPPRRR